MTKSHFQSCGGLHSAPSRSDNRTLGPQSIPTGVSSDTRESLSAPSCNTCGALVSLTASSRGTRNARGSESASSSSTRDPRNSQRASSCSNRDALGSQTASTRSTSNTLGSHSASTRSTSQRHRSCNEDNEGLCMWTHPPPLLDHKKFRKRGSSKKMRHPSHPLSGTRTTTATYAVHMDFPSHDPRHAHVAAVLDQRYSDFLTPLLREEMNDTSKRMICDLQGTRFPNMTYYGLVQ
eukprot:GEMP01081905.1.p1 GENE.GEMP01081905.1~~GEMP01081905.1.p1  ORF type:complete len:236 (+),score=43.24 GEMP01081905.1:48-755(+)